MFWDSLYKRYGDPMMLLNSYIKTGRLCEFVHEYIEIVGKEQADEKNWQYFLHKVFDKSYNDFIKEIKPVEPQSEDVTMDQVETTIKTSMNLLESFSL